MKRSQAGVFFVAVRAVILESVQMSVYPATVWGGALVTFECLVLVAGEHPCSPSRQTSLYLAEVDFKMEGIVAISRVENFFH